MRTVLGVVDWATTALSVIAGIAVTMLMVHVTIDVIARSGFDMTLPGTITIVQSYYMVFLVCLPLAFVERKNNHIMVDVFTNHMPARARRHLFGWTYLLSAFAFGLVAYGSWFEAMSQFKVLKFTIEQDISIPTWVGYFAVPLGYGMGTIYVLLKFTRYLLGLAPMAAPHDLDHEVESKGHD